MFPLATPMGYRTNTGTVGAWLPNVGLLPRVSISTYLITGFNSFPTIAMHYVITEFFAATEQSWTQSPLLL